MSAKRCVAPQLGTLPERLLPARDSLTLPICEASSRTPSLMGACNLTQLCAPTTPAMARVNLFGCAALSWWCIDACVARVVEAEARPSWFYISAAHRAASDISPISRRRSSADHELHGQHLRVTSRAPPRLREMRPALAHISALMASRAQIDFAPEN